MNSLGHLIVSVAKSAIRMVACAFSIHTGTALPLAIGFLVAEVLGVVEELVDERA